MSTSKQISGKQAAIEILRERGGPMKVAELTKQAAQRAPGMKGKTPEATIAAAIYTAAKKGETFRIVERGTVTLADQAAPQPVEELDSPAVTPSSVVLRRDGVEVKPDPKPAKMTPEQRKAKNAERMRAARAAKRAEATA